MKIRNVKNSLLVALFSLLSVASFSQTNGNFQSIRLTSNDTSSVTQTVNGTIINEKNQKFYAYIAGKWGILGGSSESKFTAPVTFILNGSKSFGKYTNGQTAPWTGLTAVQAILDAAQEYIPPVWSYFSVPAQTQAVEVGTTLSGAKTFNWAILPNSATVPTITIYDGTAGANLFANVTNNGTYTGTINTIQLNTIFANQYWYGIATISSPAGQPNFNSSIYQVTAYFYEFWGAATPPTNSATVRALPQNQFYTNGNTFILNTGNTLTTLNVELPPGVTITNVTDLDALNANVTSLYVLQGTLPVIDAGGTSRAYNNYLGTLGAPYSANHRHQVTTN